MDKVSERNHQLVRHHVVGGIYFVHCDLYRAAHRELTQLIFSFRAHDCGVADRCYHVHAGSQV